jgi:hypothetical protein
MIARMIILGYCARTMDLTGGLSDFLSGDSHARYAPCLLSLADERQRSIPRIANIVAGAELIHNLHRTHMDHS